MSRSTKAFSPIENKSFALSSTTASGSVQFTVKKTATNGGDLPENIEVYNALASLVIFVAWGVGSATADSTGYAVGPGQRVRINIGQADTVAVIPVSSATGAVYIARGDGNS